MNNTLDNIFAICLKTYECECLQNPLSINHSLSPIDDWRWAHTHYFHRHGSNKSRVAVKVRPSIPLCLITKEELAAALNGLEYPNDPPTQIEIIAAAHNLVIVYGASDDLMEFRGAIYDEISCYGGDHAFIDGEGLVTDRNAIDDDDDDALLEHLTRKKAAKTITAIWDSEGYSWIYKTTIPHATFEILESGEKYCRGIVFSLTEL